MNKDQLIEIINKHVEIYINNISRDLETRHDGRFDNFGFPIFGETSEVYFEQLYFQSYLESYTRKMINSILKELFYEECYNVVWPEFDYIGIYEGWTNIECEKKFGFEFIDQESRIGYRYTWFAPNEIDDLLVMGKVDTIELLSWEKHDDHPGIGYKDERVKAICIWDLFQELFWGMSEKEIKEMYVLFVEKIKKAIETARSKISLSTIPGFTKFYLFKSRSKTVRQFRSIVKHLSVFNIENLNYKFTEKESNQLIKQYSLASIFLDKKLEYLFVGDSPCAKSYLTSEYLYQYFVDNPMFDYTPIVSGYIKSVEQLLYFICSKYSKQKKEKVNLHLSTMGEYIEYINKNEAIFREELQPASKIIIHCLDSYAKESRNPLFHRDYSDDWRIVKQIRENTVFLYVVLLGSVNSSLSVYFDSSNEIHKLDYERLFMLLDKQANGKVSFILKGKEYADFQIERRTEGLSFDQNGFIITRILLSKFDYDHYEKVEIDRDNMPSKIWMSGLEKSKEEIWPS